MTFVIPSDFFIFEVNNQSSTNKQMQSVNINTTFRKTETDTT